MPIYSRYFEREADGSDSSLQQPLFEWNPPGKAEQHSFQNRNTDKEISLFRQRDGHQ
jgi:hypothetical protein